MNDDRRRAKIEKAILQEISVALVTQIDDPRVTGIVSITGVKVSPDLSVARVSYLIDGSEENRRTVERFFNDSRGFFRTLVAKRLDGRKTPQLTFSYDEAFERKAHIESLLDKALKEDRSAQASRGESKPDESSLGNDDEIA